MATGCKSSSSCSYATGTGNYSPVNRLEAVLGGNYNAKKAAAKDDGLAQRLYKLLGSDAFYDGSANIRESSERVTSAPTKGMATSYVGDIGAVVYGRN
ncbi:TPA: hypothetical protein HA246_02170 [Candidatus Woesearchaeota archaeon]|nr:hypothetical protein [Candidatus Woesearchaeota archaeon]